MFDIINYTGTVYDIIKKEMKIMYKYQQIANTIKKKINNQSYQPNQKLPSIVQLSKTYHCSKVTV